MSSRFLKRALYLTHRWAGISLCLFFTMWFATGIVMMYIPFPNLDSTERYSGLATIDGTQVKIGLETALNAAGLAGATGAPQRVRMTTVLNRPAIHILPDKGRWTTVFADTGEVLHSLEASAAIESVDRFHAGHRPLYQERLEMDQWTVSGGLNPFRPLHRVSLGDTEDTHYYVSDRTGEVVRDTNYQERIWNWLGANLHWIYPLVLVKHREVWHQVVVWLSVAGIALAVTGTVSGLLRWRFGAPYRSGSRSPHRGWMRWHHLLGLVSCIFVLTWIFSGLMSMNPWKLFPSKTPPAEDIRRYRGGELVATDFSRDLGQALREHGAPVYEVEWQRFGNRPYYVFRTAPLQSSTYAADRAESKFERFTEQELLTRAATLLPNSHIVQADWLTEHDAYWYARENLGRLRTLPVLRVRFDDADATWYHIDPASGQVLERMAYANRVQRWLYNGLHSFDFGFLLRYRPLWDIVVIVLVLTGLALSITGTVGAWRRLRHRSAKGNRHVH